MIKFAVMTDLHANMIHDGKQRVEKFVSEANERGCDFAIQLGDFMQPEQKGSYTCAEDRVSAVMKNTLAGKGAYAEESRTIIDSIKRLKCPFYHVMGNHDLDLYSKDEVMQYWGMKKLFYSFDVKDHHFIVLDANYGYEDGQEVAFDRGNYMKWFFKPYEPFPYVPKFELEWLENDLKTTDKPSIVFCHEGINGGFLNAINHDEIFAVLKNAPHGVELCMCGHKHEDILEYEEDIPVYFVNSISGYSVPEKYACRRFSDEIEEKHPNVRYMCVYKDPLYVIVTVEGDKISIEGKSSKFVPPTPEEVGVRFEKGNIRLSAKASNAEIPLCRKPNS